jgi:hypothetical protein
MAALWEAPFDACLYLDADTCVWGDILSIIPDAEYDVIIIRDRGFGDSALQGAYSDKEITNYFFNPQKLLVHFPEFDYGAYRDRYACSGTFFFRRGVMNLAAYQQAWALQQEDRDFFRLYEQGIWNFLVFHGVQNKVLRIQSMPFQVIPCDHPEEEMRLEYSPLCLTEKKPLKPAVLHYAGKKPDIFMRSARVATMNYFRLQYLLQMEGLPRWKALWRMALEDIQYRPMCKYIFFWPMYIFWAKWAKGKRGLRKLMRLMKVKS